MSIRNCMLGGNRYQTRLAAEELTKVRRGEGRGAWGPRSPQALMFPATAPRAGEGWLFPSPAGRARWLSTRPEFVVPFLVGRIGNPSAAAGPDGWPIRPTSKCLTTLTACLVQDGALPQPQRFEAGLHRFAQEAGEVVEPLPVLVELREGPGFLSAVGID